MTNIAPRMLAALLLLLGALGLVLARGSPRGAETVYTVPQVRSALPALSGHTILVRGILLGLMTYACDLIPVHRPCTPGMVWSIRPDVRSAVSLPVLVGTQNPVLGVLRQAHILPPYPGGDREPRVWRVYIAPHAARACSGVWPWPRAVLLDTLR
jgi:hypothetical protein